MFRLPAELNTELTNYIHSLIDFLSGKLGENRFKGIRVPWGIYSQRGGNKYMVRIRIPTGELTGEQLNILAYLAEKYGTGDLHITTRQDIQIHNIDIKDSGELLRELHKHHLSSRGGGGNTVRNILCCPLVGICRDEVFDVRPYVVGLTEFLLLNPDSYRLPRKYKIAFSGCKKDCAGATVNDLGFIAKEKNGISGFKVYVAGGMGAKSRIADLLEDFVSVEQVQNIAEAVRKVFFKHGERRDKHTARLRFLVERIGLEKFKELYKEELNQIEEPTSQYQIPNYEELPIISEEKKENNWNKYVVIPQKQKNYYIIKIRIPLGDITSAELRALAELGNLYSTIKYRTSSTQNIYIINIPSFLVDEVLKRLNSYKFHLDYPDTVLDIVCCAGATTCNLGLCNSKGLTRNILQTLQNSSINSEKLDEITIRISGCPNACGRHPIGLVSLNGIVRKIQDRSVPCYKISLGGHVKEGETQLAQPLGIIPAKNVPLLLKDFLLVLQEKNGVSTVVEYTLGKGSQILKDLIPKYEFVPPYETDVAFYKDWESEEEFSLSGLGPGECGAGVIDMIEADILEAETKLRLGKDTNSLEHLREALYISTRALLVVRGIDAKSPEEAIEGFIKEFVETRIASEKFKDIKVVFENKYIPFKELEEYTSSLLEEVKNLYKNMNPDFTFPVSSIAKSSSETDQVQIKKLDLRGVACPINYVKTKLFLETLPVGSTVEVLLDEGEPIKNVPVSLKSDGQEILNIQKIDENHYSVIIKKKI